GTEHPRRARRPLHPAEFGRRTGAADARLPVPHRRASRGHRRAAPPPVHPGVIGPHEAVRLVAFLLSGAALPQDGEPEVDRADITAALSLVPRARAEMDELEAGLLQMARGRGMTWPEIAFGLGLRSPQAARQRYERLADRTETTEG
ncbi:LOW QUALITY PROTEIN: conserved hypothetical protein, partial [Streptomyces griseoflavus Tu4000]